jgi:hypothetical protein
MAWTTYFQGVMGVVPPPLQVDAGNGMLQSLYSACRWDPLPLAHVIPCEVAGMNSLKDSLLQM